VGVRSATVDDARLGERLSAGSSAHRTCRTALVLWRAMPRRPGIRRESGRCAHRGADRCATPTSVR